MNLNNSINNSVYRIINRFTYKRCCNFIYLYKCIQEQENKITNLETK